MATSRRRALWYICATLCNSDSNSDDVCHTQRDPNGVVHTQPACIDITAANSLLAADPLSPLAKSPLLWLSIVETLHEESRKASFWKARWKRIPVFHQQHTVSWTHCSSACEVIKTASISAYYNNNLIMTIYGLEESRSEWRRNGSERI